MATSFVFGLRAPRPAVVWGSSPQLTAALAALAVATVRRRPFILEVRDVWPHILLEAGMITEAAATYRALKVLERLLYRNADAIVILAQGSATYITDEGVASDKLVFVPNGADPDDFKVKESRASLRREFGFDQLTVVYAGAHGPANGLNLVLDAAEKLQSEMEVTFVLVGNGAIKRSLQADAARRGLMNIKFFDPIPKAEIPRIYAACDIGLHCLADMELFKSAVSPNKLYDYMAAGLPVITNTSGEVASIVEHAGAGVAVANGDIASGVRSLASRAPEELATLGDAGIAWMKINRSPAAMAERIEELLNKVSR